MPEIKDSGARREFGTGAVRDMAEGKGRNDLLHPVVMLLCVEHLVEIPQYEMYRLNCEVIMEKCKKELYTYYQADHNAIYSLLNAYWFACYLQCRVDPKVCFAEEKPMIVLTVGTMELAKHYEKGAKKYGDHNWSKGIPSVSFYDSAHRHIDKCILGQEDEPHLSAYMFNIVGLIYNHLYRKELEFKIYEGGKRKPDPEEAKATDAS